MLIQKQPLQLLIGSMVRILMDRKSKLNLLRRESPKEALEEVEDEEVRGVDVEVVVTEGVVGMTIMVVAAEEEEWNLVLETGTAHRAVT